MQVKRAYKFRFYPSKSQIDNLNQTFGCTRFVYNYMLRLRMDAWYNNQESINYNKTSALLTELKKEVQYAWLNEVSAVPLQQCLRNLQVAYQNFWAKRAKYPTFRKKENHQSAIYADTAFRLNGTKLILAKQTEPLSIRWCRRLPEDCKVTTITISKDCSERYFVSLLCDDVIEPKEVSNNKIGIDLGLTHFATISTGEKIVAPKIFRKYEKKLGKKQKILSKKQKGSNERKKARIKVAKVHAKISDSRSDFLHKLSTRLINENQIIAVESLSVKNMQKNKKVSKSIGDAGWSEFLRQLTYKALWYGRKLIGIDKWYPSSKRCNSCGYILEKLKLSIRKWICPDCKVEHDRDINASKNILAAGQAVLASGESISPICI
jgi:putative transposase